MPVIGHIRDYHIDEGRSGRVAQQIDSGIDVHIFFRDAAALAVCIDPVAVHYGRGRIRRAEGVFRIKIQKRVGERPETYHAYDKRKEHEQQNDAKYALDCYVFSDVSDHKMTDPSGVCAALINALFTS